MSSNMAWPVSTNHSHIKASSLGLTSMATKNWGSATLTILDRRPCRSRSRGKSWTMSRTLPCLTTLKDRSQLAVSRVETDPSRVSWQFRSSDCHNLPKWDLALRAISRILIWGKDGSCLWRMMAKNHPDRTVATAGSPATKPTDQPHLSTWRSRIIRWPMSTILTNPCSRSYSLMRRVLASASFTSPSPASQTNPWTRVTLSLSPIISSMHALTVRTVTRSTDRKIRWP